MVEFGAQILPMLPSAHYITYKLDQNNENVFSF